MQKPSDPATQKRHTAIKSAFSGKAEVADTVQVEIRDRGEVTTCEEVLQAVNDEEECDIPAGAAPRMRKAYGGTQTATVHLRPEHAQRILDKGKIRVGWVVWRIRQKREPMLQMHGIRPHVCQMPSVRGNSQKHAAILLRMPYKDKHEGVWQRSSDGRAAIWSCGQPPGHLSQRASRMGYTRAKIKGITFYSCYIAPSVHISEFKTIMQEIADDARGRSHILIAGDFDAWSTTWGNASTTQRGTNPP